jgi:thiol-disulfide isomerase/thioredoxin
MSAERFVDVSATTTTDFDEDGRSIALCDWNNDGAIDLILRNRNAPRLQVLQNNLKHNNWLQVKLVGNGTTVNSDAIGTKVTATIDGVPMVKTLVAGDGYLNQSSKTLFFGVGDASEIESLVINWPDGSSTEHQHLQCNQALVADQKSSKLMPVDVVSAGQITRAGTWHGVEDKDVWRIPLMSRLPMAAIPIPSDAKPGRKVGDLSGSPVLLNFWSTTCATCLSELEELSLARPKLGRHHLQVVPMNSDGVDAKQLAARLLKGFELDKLAGSSDDNLLEIVQVIVSEVLGANVDIPLPFSLLIDGNGDLVAIYFGKMQIQGLLRDLRLLKSQNPKSPDLSALSFGSRLVFRDRSFESLATEFTKIGQDSLASYYQQYVGRFLPPRK